MTPAQTTRALTTDGSPNYVLDVKKILAGMAEPRLAYQPVVDLDRGVVVGYEALARFGSGHRTPGAWFAAADGIGRLAELESLLLQQALDSRTALPPDCWLSINVSPKLLLGGPVWSTLTAAGDLTGVVLELTEHQHVDNLSRLRRRLDTVREAGGLLALDDVGAGWSGLRQVVELRPEIVKIDRSLVARLHEDPARMAVAELLSAFTERVGGALLAEGVEQLDELSTLLSLDVHLGQGYLLGRPQFGWAQVPPEAATMLATRSRAERQVGSLVVAVPAAPNVAAVGFLADHLPDVALLVDSSHAVESMWLRNTAGTGPSGWTRPVTSIPTATTLRAALCRGMERPERYRLDPLICTQPDGSVAGVVTIDALVTALV
ncbi:MAG: diguanylate phosphodiesterase [Frankiales bacterium]|jgi:EAL domain-containing protein (putative c-di-GMP-specific phosphodiesterase class I)|nr:diguanylate phosphodiesterase [Frankiales bacterium]